ncbi:MAG: excinuclease ABC subunit UvrA [Candidatus Nomurabacteria bacterium]|nr:excinuclease ABC subunit UvrA [Candidatus Nomurabacteria bacterium]
MKNNKEEKIIVRGARTHNLKNITVEMPRNKMICITGMSGSGKSSLAFDTIFAEGQRRYVESLSSYARQFLKQMAKPDVDEIEGLSPAISIDQKSRSNNPRSTVATITEVYDYLRVLYSRIGKPHCLECGTEIKKLSNEEIMNFVKEKAESFLASGKKKEVMGVNWTEVNIKIFAPVVRGRKGEYYQLLYDLLGKGYAKVRINGEIKNLRDRIDLAKTKKHDIDVLVDEITFHKVKDKSEDENMRLFEAVERALLESDGLVSITYNDVESVFYSAKFSCPNDGFSFPEVEPRLFSWNSPYGACETCHGLGTKHMFGDDPCDACKGLRLRPEALHVYIEADSFPPSLRGKMKGGVESEHPTPTLPLAKERGNSKTCRMNIIEAISLSAEDAFEFFGSLKLSKKEEEISGVLMKEILSRIEFLLNVGLEYISLDRRANTLSGGEAQRIRLASQLGSRLVGTLYVLDEPTIGLHQRDNERLIKTLEDLRDLGNTIIVVEHDEDTIYASDYIIDIGPKAGVHGGNVIVADDLEKLLSAPKNTSKSRTLGYLRGEIKIEIPEKRRTSEKGSIKIVGGKVFNIKNLNAEIPLGKLVSITGVSGSGKSSFMYEILHKNLQGRLERKYRTNEVYNCASFSGSEYISRVVLIDQSAIGRTPRSNLATYTGAFTYIRELFAETEEARFRGWKSNRFSFNVSSKTGGGRCEACEGNGEIAVEMHFLPTVYVTCDVCMGKRFDKETLKVKYKGKNIYEVLKMTVEEAFTFFEDIPNVFDRVKTLMDVGLGYVELGQSATTLSGGEAQRVKISSELFRPYLEKTIYLLDEPTVGLHYDDVQNLINVLNRLVDKGNTVVVIEHNMDLIKSADYLLDFGPEGGANGGTLIAKGTPEEVANTPKSYTGKYLKKVLRK